MNRFLLLFFGLALLSSCIDRIEITIPKSNTGQFVVDGLITDEPGPYTVKLSLAENVNGFLNFAKPTSAKKITLFDNVGNTEVMVEVENGKYETKPNGIRGVIGREYAIRIEMQDGKIYESLPDKLNPVGTLDSLYYEFVSTQPLDGQTQYGFRFFIDSQGLGKGEDLVRWRFRSIFELDSEPNLRLVPCRGGAPCACPAPAECSGYVVFQGDVVEVGPCSCCTCWVTRPETKPNIGDYQFFANQQGRRIEVGYIPLEYFPFKKGKNRAEVWQMSLSQQAYDYWRTVQIQKEGAASLFQFPAGKLNTTIFEKTGTGGSALGIFSASAVKKKQLYLKKDDVKIVFSVIPDWDCQIGTGIIPESCLKAYPYSSNERPADWQ